MAESRRRKPLKRSMANADEVSFDKDRDERDNARIGKKKILMINTQVGTIPYENMTRTIHVVVHGDLHREAVPYVRGTAMRR